METQSDKATLQVQLNSEGALLLQPVAPCWLRSARPPYARTTVTLFFLFFPFLATHVIRLLLVLIQTQRYSFTLVYRLLQRCVCPQTGTLSSVRFFL